MAKLLAVPIGIFFFSAFAVCYLVCVITNFQPTSEFVGLMSFLNISGAASICLAKD
jgi:hypothetical protein